MFRRETGPARPAASYVMYGSSKGKYNLYSLVLNLERFTRHPGFNKLNASLVQGSVLRT